MKTIIKLITAIAFLIIICLFVLYFSLNNIVEKGIRTFAPQVTLTDVTLEKSNISLFSGKGELKGLVIGNPEGFSENNAVTLDTIKVEVDVKSIFSDILRIKRISIDGPKISYEIDGKRNNIKTIRNNIKSFTKIDGNQKETDRNKKDTQKKIIIDLLEIKNGEIGLAATFFKGKGVSLELTEIMVRDMGREKGGLSPAETSFEIFKVLSNSVTSAVSVSTGTLREKADALLDRFKGILDK